MRTNTFSPTESAEDPPPTPLDLRARGVVARAGAEKTAKWPGEPAAFSAWSVRTLDTRFFPRKSRTYARHSWAEITDRVFVPSVSPLPSFATDHVLHLASRVLYLDPRAYCTRARNRVRISYSPTRLKPTFLRVASAIKLARYLTEEEISLGRDGNVFVKIGLAARAKRAFRANVRSCLRVRCVR